MIGSLRGKLLRKEPPWIVIECGGVGYEMHVPMSTFYRLPACQQDVMVLTHLAVREDAHQLFGFLSEDERSAFRLLIRVNGIGTRTALSILSGLSVHELAQSITSNDSSRLIKIPGIGKKTAERLLLELQGQLSAHQPPNTPSLQENTHQEIMQALIALGYSERDAGVAVETLPKDIGINEGIKQALKFFINR